MIVLPHGAGPAHLEDHWTERGWLPRPGPAFVMISAIESLPASRADVEFAPEPDDALLSRSPPGALEPAPSLVARRKLLETGNDPARALYLRCGFRDSHRYRYMMAP